MVEGLASACTSRAPLASTSAPQACTGWATQCEGIFLQLLAHRSHAVALAVYSLLESMVQAVGADHAGADSAEGAAAGGQHPLMQLLIRQVGLQLHVTGLWH